MKKIPINNFKEQLFYEKLDNGLEIFLVPLTNKNNYTCTFGTKYGARNINFKINDKLINTPTGIAHFLEHKMFEKKENPFKYYQKYGTDVNASTSHNFTIYYIQGNKSYAKNLAYLIDWLSNLNLTDDLVEKEKGIILEEASMYKDNPDRILIEKLKENIFINDTYRYKVIGTDEDIKSITKEQLETCYNSFYRLDNMYLIIAGKFDPQKTIEIVKEHTKNYQSNSNKIEIVNQNEPEKVYKEYEELYMNVDIPRVGLAYKIKRNIFDDLNLDDIMLDFYLNSLINIGLGLTSDIREKWLNDKLFISSNYKISKTKDYYIFEFSALSNKPNELSNEMMKYIKNIQIDEKSFERQKKSWISSEVKAISNIHSISYNILDDILEYNSFIPNKIELIKRMNYDTLKKIKEKLYFDHYSLIIIKDKKDEKR